MSDSAKWQQLVEIMAQLRGENGCPWDKEQDHDSLKRYLLEESYEVLDAIDRRDDASLCDELGDLLLQVVFHARLAEEGGRFTIDDVVDGINAKMIRRHPHIFADQHADDSEGVLTMWEAIKAREKAASGSGSSSIMQANENLPALMLAQKMQDKAHRVGFDWENIEGPQAKLAEEIDELAASRTQAEAEEELGDVLFSVVNLARFHKVDAEQALRAAVRKFVRRFQHVEAKVDTRWEDYDINAMEELWQQAKRLEEEGKL